ncbi:hypothetical protein DBV15_12886, partial [Temnothorax longispinosus]
RMLKIGKCGEQGGNEGQDDRGVTENGGWGVAKAARESFDISTRIPTRDVCALSSRPTTSVNAFPAITVIIRDRIPVENNVVHGRTNMNTKRCIVPFTPSLKPDPISMFPADGRFESRVNGLVIISRYHPPMEI